MNVNGNTRLADQSKFGQIEDKMARNVKPPGQPKVRSGEPAPTQEPAGDAAQAQQNPLAAVVQKLFEAIQGLLNSMFGGGGAGGAEGGGQANGAAGTGAGAGGAGAAAGAAAVGAGAAGSEGAAGAAGAGGGAGKPGNTLQSAAAVGIIFVGIGVAGQQSGSGQPGSTGSSEASAGAAAGAAAGEWNASAVAGGKATIDLGSKYQLKLNENRSEMILVNKETGHETRVWGDPHLDFDNNGQTADDAMFKGTMTFKLPDDTKITINTQPANNRPGQTFADKLTITKGDDAFVVNGLSQNQRGDLTVEHRKDGKALEAATDDGYVMTERADGQGFISETLGRRPTKADLEAAHA